MITQKQIAKALAAKEARGLCEHELMTVVGQAPGTIPSWVCDDCDMRVALEGAGVDLDAQMAWVFNADVSSGRGDRDEAEDTDWEIDTRSGCGTISAGADFNTRQIYLVTGNSDEMALSANETRRLIAMLKTELEELEKHSAKIRD